MCAARASVARSQRILVPTLRMCVLLAASGRATLHAAEQPSGLLTVDGAIVLPHAVRERYPSAVPLCPGKLLYAATDDAFGGGVCVKLVASREYGSDVHRLWAEHELAPRLHAVEEQQDGWTLVTMELLAAPQWVPLTAWCRAGGPAAVDRARVAVAAALKRAHALRLAGSATVHGDCRGVNVMVRCSHFDRAGTESGHGARTYGALLSPHVPWPSGVGPGAVMEQAHDAEWLARDCWPWDS